MGKQSLYKSSSSRVNQDNLTYLSQAIFRSSGAGIYIVQEGKFVYVSPLIEQLSGYNKKDILGMNCLDLVYSADREIVLTKAVNNLKKPSASIPYEYRFIRKNGQPCWVMERVMSIKYYRKRAVMGSILDITEKKRIEMELARSEEKFRTILEHMQDGYYELDLAVNFSYANYAASDTLGYTREEMIGKNYRIITPADEQKNIFAAFNQVYRTGIPDKAFSHGFLRKDGSIASTESSIDLCRREDGEINGFRCISRDVTERKQIEKELLRSEDRFRTIIERMQDIYLEIDLQGNYTFANYAVIDTLGYSRAEVIGLNYRQLVPADDVQDLFHAYNDVFRTGIPNKGFTHKFICKDGKTIFMESTIDLQTSEVGDIIGFSTVSRDITVRKALEEDLRQSEKRYRTILEEIEDAYCEVDRAGNFTFVNDSTCRDTGYSIDELIGVNYRKVTFSDDINAVYEVFNRVYRTAIPNKAFSHRIIRKDGVIRFVENAISQLKNKHGEIVGFRCVSRDVTERKQLEEALARSEEIYRTILEQMQDAYYEIDLAGNFLFANEATCSILGITLNDLIGMNYHGLIPEDDRPAVLNAFNYVLSTGVPNRGFAHRVVLSNGNIAFAEISISLLKDKQDKLIGFRCVGRDVTERKQIEQMLADMATHDFLTGLPNRVLLIDRFEIALSQAQRNQNKLAIMSLDLDRFKEVNDTMGHSTGDEVLKQVANRLTATVRSSDTVARLGGDEFLLLLQDIHDINDATTIADKILSSLKEPLSVEGHSFLLSASIGIAVYPDVGSTLEKLMKQSDASMYYSKHRGGGQYKVYGNDRS